MKKNAFTLIELLGVISIIGLIVLIAFPTIEKNIKNSKQKLYNNQISNIESGMKNWATENLSYLPSEDGEMVTLSLYQLKQGGYVKEDILNPLSDELFPNDMLVTITKNNNCFNYEVLTSTGTQTGTAVINPDAPVVFLNGGPVIYIEVYGTFFDPGGTALNSEGEPIDQSNVVITISGDGSYIDVNSLGNYTIKYTVTDPDNGLKTTVTRNVVVRDKIKPNLVVPNNVALNAADVLSFNARTGAIANDNYDGDLTSQIEITGNLSILPGNYYLTYKIIDSSGNIATKKRTITVNAEYAEWKKYNVVNSTVYVDVATAITTPILYGYYPGDCTQYYSAAGVTLNTTTGIYEPSNPSLTETTGGVINIPSFVRLERNRWVLPTAVIQNGGPIELWATAGTLHTATATQVASKGTFVETVTGIKGVYPDNGEQDSYWYELVVPDTTPPVITIVGDNPIYFHVCMLNYVDPGATATDNVDGNLTSQIQKVEDVYGTHTITYTVTDAAGNTTTVVRNMNYVSAPCGA